MTRSILFITLALSINAASWRDFKVEDREPIRQTFNNDKALEVDNLNGSITVIGDGGSTIRVEGEKLIRAADQTELQRAKREVILDANEKDGTARLYVNGPFLTNIEGYGTADTLNGTTAITFRENPKQDSYFKSFNGKVDVTFQPNLSANVKVKTYNVFAYTDFDVKSNQFQNMKIGNGSPELKFESFNGSIRIQKAK